MNINQIMTGLKKIKTYIDKRRNALFRIPVEKQLAYIDKFREPKNDIERSYFQYKAQMFLNGWVTTLVINFVSYFLLFLILFKSVDRTNYSLEKRDLIYLLDGKSETIIPKSLKNETKSHLEIKNPKMLITNYEKKVLIKLLKKYFFSPFFILKCVENIGKYHLIVTMYSPKAVVSCIEYNFSSSFLTNFLETKGIEHINIMHGEKLLYIRDSFFRFTKFYLWNKHYIDIFRKLRADKSIFIIEPLHSNLIIQTFDVDFKYYLTYENRKQIKSIYHLLEKLAAEGYTYKVRFHPRYSKLKLLEIYFKNNIENPYDCSLYNSFKETKYILSLYSTVLSEAKSMHLNIVIDDVTDEKRYNKLSKMMYINLNNENIRVSSFIK